MTTTDLSSTGARRIPVDSSHFAVRFLVPVAAFGMALLFHVLGLYLFDSMLDDQNLPATCVLVPIDLIVFFLAAYLTEAGLKRALPSRRHADLDAAALVITDGRKTPPQIARVAWEQTVNAQAWRFQVKRRSRVPKGWFCMAIHLLQDDTDMILYTFMPEDRAKELPGYHNFVRLRPRKETRNNPDLAVAAQQRRLLKCEDRRWDDGAEISPDDFEAVIAVMAVAIPEWE